VSHSCEVNDKAQSEPNQVTLYEESHSYKEDTVAHPDLIIATSSPEFTTGHMVPTEVNGEQVNFLLDTGSAVTLLRQDVWKRCSTAANQLEKWDGARLVGVDGTPLSVIGSRKINFCFTGVSFPHSVLVVESLLCEGILGMDFLEHNQCSIDLTREGGALFVGPHKTRIGLTTTATAKCECASVTVAHTVCIPARSIVEITANVQGSVSNGDAYLLEGTEGSNSPTLIARAVVQPSDNKVIVQVLNAQKHPITLHRKSTIAQIQLINAVCVAATDTPGCPQANTPVTPEKQQFLWQMALQSQGTLSEDETSVFFELLLKFADIFACSDDALGRTSILQHSINTEASPPIRQPVRRVPPNKKQEVGQLLEQMLKKDVIQPSSSPWAAPIVLVQKKDGSTRFCVDYRKLNSVTRKDAYPLPQITDTLDTLHGSKWFSTLDLASGYWQVEVDQLDRHKTAFCTPHGLYEFKVMPFGLCNAPATFQRLMDLMLTGLQWSSCLVYLDDIIVLGKDFSDHLRNIDLVFHRIQNAGLKLQPPKCNFFQEKVAYLGHIVSSDGVSVDPSKVDKVQNWPTPQNTKDVQQFLGLANYYRRFIRNFADLAKPLHKLTERNVAFSWTQECQDAFDSLRLKLTSTPILAYPDFNKSFLLDTDASNSGIGAVLSQVGDDGLEHVVAYASRLLTKPERRYCVTRRELLAVVTFTKHFRPYLLGKHFTLRTDHGSLQWLYNFKEPEGQMARWLQTLQEFDFQIVHRKGRLHNNADALSRVPCEPYSQDQVCNQVTYAPLVATTLLTAQQDVQITQLQSEDPVLGPIIEGLKQRTYPTIQHHTLESRRLLQLWDQLLLKDNVLFCRLPSPTGQGLCDKLVVPKSIRTEVLKELHEGAIGGHLGSDKTLWKLKERFYWPGHYTEVKKWCSTCAVCAQRKNPTPKPTAKLCPVTVNAPMELVAMDILGPLPESSAGNSYILVMGDYFTKWMEVYPIPNQEATTVANKLVDEFVCRFSVPKQLHSDQGAQFESQVVAEVCRLLHIDKTRTTPYHPQSDGLIERFNRTLLQMLATCTDTHPFDWEDHVKKVCMAYNVSKQSSTHHSPFFLMFGRQAQLPIDVMYGIPGQSTSSVPQYVTKLGNVFQEAFSEARKNITTHQERQVECYNKRIHGHPFTPGTLVWLFNPVVPRGSFRKFHKPWTGPYQVIEKVSENNYRIRRTQRPFKVKVVHFDRLKLCHPDTRFPQSSSQTTPKGTPASESVPRQPVGANIELVDDSETPSHRYPQRTLRAAPSRYADFVQH